MEEESKTSPSRVQGRALQLWVISVLIGLGCFFLAWGLENLFVRWEFYPLVRVQGAVYDRGMTLAARRSQESGSTGRVVVVAVDETARQRLESVPSFLEGVPGPLKYDEWERAFHARTLLNLKKLGARVVAFDMVFEEEKPKTDPVFARAIRDHGRVVLAALDEQGLASGAFEQTHNLQYPVYALRQAAAGMGLTNMPLDQDGTLRRFWWWFPGIDDDANDVLIPSLGVASAALYERSDPRTVIEKEVKARRAFLGRPIEWMPGKDSPTSFIRFFGQSGAPAGPESRLSYADLFFAFDSESAGITPQELRDQREWLRKQIEGKIVLIGDATQLNQDYHRVPVFSRREHASDTQMMPGVEIQAHTVLTALTGRWVRQASPTAQVLLLLVTCLLVATVGRVLDPRSFVLVGIALTGGLYVSSISLVAYAGYWIEPATPSFGLALTLLAESVAMYFAERRQRERVRRQLARQVGPGVADTLAEEDWPEFGGESREITMLFSDLKGFTSLSETMTPPEICTLLNRYFGVVFPLVFKYGGTVDKLMGDGMMAYFGWPDRRPNHAERAVQCALEMQTALREWQALPENASLPPLLTRVGIHTGVATIGEIGHGERAEFTVIGDIVNVASRLEGMNKEFGTTILITEVTREAAGDLAPMVFRGAAAVRGRKEPMPVYSVEPDLAGQETPREPALAAAGHP